MEHNNQPLQSPRQFPLPPPRPPGLPAAHDEPPVGLYYDLGICNQMGFLNHYLGESPVAATMKFAPLDRRPVIRPFHHDLLLSMAHVYAEARYHAANIQNPPLRRAIAIGETLAPMVPNAKFDTTDNSRDSFVEWMKRGLQDNVFDVLGDYTEESYREFITGLDVTGHWLQGEIPESYPPTRAQIATIDFPKSFLFCYFFAKGMRTPARQLAISHITHAYCALSKRGQVTDEFCGKINTAVRDELGVTIALQSGTLNTLFKSYMQGVNERNAQGVFNRLEHQLPDIALRLKLTLMQASGSGLTLFTIIGRTIRLYHDFPWGRVNTLTGGELANWNVALRAVGNNFYYGFKRDLGPARSTQYKTLGYVARDLLMKINGEVTLRRYMGLTGNVKNKRQIDCDVPV